MSNVKVLMVANVGVLLGVVKQIKSECLIISDPIQLMSDGETDQLIMQPYLIQFTDSKDHEFVKASIVSISDANAFMTEQYKEYIDGMYGKKSDLIVPEEKNIITSL